MIGFVITFFGHSQGCSQDVSKEGGGVTLLNMVLAFLQPEYRNLFACKRLTKGFKLFLSRQPRSIPLPLYVGSGK